MCLIPIHCIYTSLLTNRTKCCIIPILHVCFFSDHFEKLESIIAKPNSTVSITIEYPPTDLPRKLITLFIIKTSKNHLPYKILHMDGGVGNNFLKATIESDIGTGLSFIWIIETISEVGSKEDRINSLLQDLLDKENLKNT